MEPSTDPNAEELFHEDEPMPADQRDRPGTPTEETIVLKPFQEAAVAEAVQRYTYTGRKRSQLIYGGTGSGKTVVCIETLLRTMHQDLQTNPTPEIVLIVTPAVGGNLGPQWRNELVRQGVDASRVVTLSNPFYRGKTDKWWASLRQNPPFTRCDSPLFVITTFHTLHNSVKKFGDSSIYMDLKFTHMVVDECQFYRNGSHRSKKEDVDPDKVMFGSIVSVQRQSSCRVLVASATPFYNNRVDVYSLVVLMNLANGNKSSWQRDATPAQWKAQKDWLWNNHVIAISVPPEVSRKECIMRHDPIISTLSERESKLAMDSYGHLANLIIRVLAALQKLPSQDPAVHAEIDSTMKIMLGQLTRCRRGVQHPAFYDEPIKKMVNGKETVMPVPLSRLDDFPTAECSKFNAVVEMLKGQTGRVLMTSHFSRPLDFLEVYLKRHLPEWSVIVHHGSTNCVQALRDFKRLGETRNVVMLATAGSVGEGINLSMTTEGGTKPVTLVCLDFPLTSSAQKQLEGRTKRPLAQPDVDHWDVHRIESMANLPRPDHHPPTDEWDGRRTTVDQALKAVLAMKENEAEQVLASEEEVAALAERGRRSNYGSDAKKSMNSLLSALLDVCTQWSEVQSPEEKALEKRKRDLKRAEKKRKRAA
jgi:hypothetical protein